MRITKEGYPHIIVFGILMILSIFSHFKFLFYLFFVLFLFSMYFFRDPVRFSPKIPNFFVSPADGKVLKIEEVIPESQSGNNTDLATLGAIIGFLLMMILDTSL